MAFTSPTIEALALNKPAVFYDPSGIMRNNYMETFSGIYLTDINSLKHFLVNILNYNKNEEFVLEKKKEIGIYNYILGVKKIHHDINDYFLNL